MSTGFHPFILRMISLKFYQPFHSETLVKLFLDQNQLYVQPGLVSLYPASTFYRIVDSFIDPKKGKKALAADWHLC
jgi:hypothetical protein